MTAVQKLTMRLHNLPEEKREAIALALLKAWDAQDWDHLIAENIRAGKLDFLLNELNADIEAGNIRPL